MKKILLLLLIGFCGVTVCAQHGYFCVGMNGNFSRFPGSTFALEMKGEARIDHSPFYLTWHYAAGANYNADTYYRSSLLLELYNNPEWWKISDHSRHPLAELLFDVVFPVSCPTGLADYFIDSPNRRVKAGIYVNFFERDYWEISHSVVDAWSPEIGYKMYYNMRGNCSLYFSVGGSIAVNMLNQGMLGRDLNLSHLNISIGLAHRGAD